MRNLISVILFFLELILAIVVLINLLKLSYLFIRKKQTKKYKSSKKWAIKRLLMLVGSLAFVFIVDYLYVKVFKPFPVY